MTDNTPHIIVGRMVNVQLHGGQYVEIPAKIDTGADTSAIDVSRVEVNPNGELEYTLFHPGVRFYDGVLHATKNFRVKVVKSSTGHVQVRYAVVIPIFIASKRVKGTFTLTDRSKSTFPILIGAKLLKNKFVVDVAYNYDEYRKQLNKYKDPDNTLSSQYTARSHEDPVEFYKEVYLKQVDEL